MRCFICPLLLCLAGISAGCNVPVFVLGDEVGEKASDQESQNEFLQELRNYKPPQKPASAAMSQPYTVKLVVGEGLVPRYDKPGYTFGGASFSAWEALAEEGLFHYSYFAGGKCQAADMLDEIQNRSKGDEREKRGAFFKKMDEWKRLYPDSRAWHLAHVEALIGRAWRERGGGYANEVTQEGWEGWKSHLTMAQDAAASAIDQGIQHPALYAALIEIGMGLNYSDSAMLALFCKGLEIDPLYSALYSRMGLACSPKWGGNPSDWKRIRDAAVAVTWERTGNLASFNFCTSLEGAGAEWGELAGAFGWEELKSGYEHFHTFFPDACWASDDITLLACAYDQKDYARKRFLHGCNNSSGARAAGMYAAWRKWAVDGAPRPETTPLHEAAANGDTPLVRKLLEEGMSLDAPDPKGNTPLMLAVNEDSWEAVRLLLSRGADPNSRGAAGHPLIQLLATNQQTDLVRLAITRGADPNATNENGYSALHAAVYKKDPELLKVLLSAPGINLETFSDTYAKPLAYAAARDSFECMKLLVEHGADIHSGGKSDYYPALVLAAENGRLDMAEYLLEHGANVNGDVEPDSRWSAFLAAVDKENIPMMDLLLEHGADVNAAQTDGWSAMHMAAMNGSLPLLQKLIDLGGNVNVQTDTGRSLLHQAVKSDHPEVVRYLLEKGIDKSLLDTEGRTAVAYAEELKRTEIVALLRGEF